MLILTNVVQIIHMVDVGIAGLGQSNVGTRQNRASDLCRRKNIDDLYRGARAGL